MSAASVVGREFDGALLARLFDNEDVVTRALDELWRKRVIRENGPNSYDFTHDKIREVAYIETSVPQRRLWHRRVAEALIAVSSQSASNGSAQVAAHYAQAGLFEQAVPFYLKATNVTQALYAHDHTIALALRCLALLHQLPSTPQRDAWELELQLVLAPSYRVTKGWAAPELGNVLDRALTLCDRVGTEPQRVTVLYGMQSFYAVAGLLEKSSLITDELVHVLQRAAGAQPPRAAFAMQAGLRVLRGQFEAGSAHMDRLVEPSGQMDAQHFQQLQQSQGLNYEVHLRVWQSHALWCLGQPDTALNRALHAVKMAEQLAQPFSLAIASTYLALLQQLRQALELVTAANATYYRAWCTILVAYACTLEAADDTGLAPLSDAIEQFKATGARVRLPYYLALLAEAHLRANQAHAGLEIVEQALSHSHSTGEHWWDAELYRLRAELLCIHGANSEQVEIALQRALEIARTQRAKSLELRAASSLARQWASAGRVRQARDLLTPIYSAFTEGLDTPDLLGAATLLHQC
jgi:predicted ATPase